METILNAGLSNSLAVLILAPLTLLLARVSRRPALRHAFWLLLLLKFLTPPLVSVPILPAETKPAAARAVRPVSEFEGPVSYRLVDSAEEEVIPPAPPIEGLSDPRPIETPRWSPSWRELIAMAWLAGSVSWLLLATWRVARFRAVMLRAGRAPEEICERVRDLSERIGLPRPPEVRIVSGRVSPMVLAFFGRPILVLPEELWSRLDPVQRGALLIHELAHLKRGDHRVRLLEMIATGIYWWHPALWLARRELHRAEEQCCDLWVVWALPEAAKTYATALVEAVDFLSEGPLPRPPAWASGMGQVEDLSRRIAMIMRADVPRSLPRIALLPILAIAALLLPLRATRARQDRPEPAAPQQETAAKPASPAPATEEEGVAILKEQIAIAQREVEQAKQGLQNGTMSEGAYNAARKKLLNVRLRLADRLRDQTGSKTASDEVIALLKEKLELAETSFQQAEKLSRAGAISQYEIEQAKMAVAEAKLELLDASRKIAQSGEAAKPDPRDAINADIARSRIALKKAGVMKAEAERKQAMALTGRVERLQKKGIGYVSQEEKEKADAELEIADAKLAQSKSELAIAEAEARSDEAAALQARIAVKRAVIAEALGLRGQAIANVNRVERLKKKGLGYVSDDEKAKAETDLMIAEAEVEQAKASLAEAEAMAAPSRPPFRPEVPAIPSPLTPKSEAPAEAQKAHLRDIGLAILSYQEKNGHFPSPSIQGEKSSGPLLSWRVAILPYLGLQDLYNEFKLDEPWNSPHNSALVAKMPAIFRSGDGNNEEGKTSFVAVASPESIWSGRATVAEIKDGTRNTLLVVEATKPVTWTKPEDLDLVPPVGGGQSPAPAVGKTGSSGFLAVFADASVRFLKLPIDPRIFHALGTKNGGEALEETHYGRGEASAPSAPANPEPLIVSAVEVAIREEFDRLPEVREVLDSIHDVQSKLDETAKRVLDRSDPVFVPIARKRDELVAQYMDLWTKSYPGLKRKVLNRPAEEPRVAELQAKLDSVLKAVEAMRQEKAASSVKFENEDQIVTLLSASEESDEQVIRDTYKYVTRREPDDDELKTASLAFDVNKNRGTPRSNAVKVLYRKLLRKKMLEQP